MMSQTAVLLLKTGAVLSFIVALLHVVIIFVGAPAYRYFRAGEKMAVMAERGSLYPALLTLFITLVFTVFGFYGLSGAGIIRRLPMLSIALVLIGSIFMLRGLAFFLQIFKVVISENEPRDVIFSFVSLTIGLIWLTGTILHWKSLHSASE